MTRGARHSVFSERLMFNVSATDAATDEAAQMRRFVAWLNEKQKLGVIREAVISALFEKFKRETLATAPDIYHEPSSGGEQQVVKPESQMPPSKPDAKPQPLVSSTQVEARPQPVSSHVELAPDHMPAAAPVVGGGDPRDMDAHAVEELPATHGFGNKFNVMG